MDKIVIYDTETTNSTIWGSIIEVGAVVVDRNLKEIGKLNIRGRMPEGEVPSAKALPSIMSFSSIDSIYLSLYSIRNSDHFSNEIIADLISNSVAT